MGPAPAVLPLAATAWGVVDAALRFAAVVVGVAWAAVAAPVRAAAAGAGSPRDSASSRRRMLITPSRDVIWRWSKAIITCSAVWGGRGRLGGSAASLAPLGAAAAARRRPLVDSRGRCAREKGCQCCIVGRCRRAASWVAHRAHSARAREGGDAGAPKEKTRRLRMS